MRASVFVGRVGGLAVALGIGAAAGCLTSGVAGASPDESTDSSARSGSAAAGSTRDGTSGSRSRAGRSAAQETSSGGRESGGVKGARGPAVKNDSDSDTVTARVGADGLASALPAQSALPPVRVSTEVAETRRIRPAASTANGVVPAAPPVINAVPGASAEAVGEAPTMTPAVAAAASLEAVDGAWTGSVPGAPGESAASWMMVAAARRETRNRAIMLDTAARTVAAGGVPDAEKLPAAAAAAVVGGDSVHAVTPATAEVSVDPITAIVQQVQAVISGIVEAVAQFVNQVVTVVNQIVTAIVNIFVPTVPVNSAPTVASPTVGVPDSVTGAVTGMVSATDADGDVLTYSAPAGTSKGSISIDSTNGAFTYTPTLAARHAAANPGVNESDQTDTFTVAIADGHGGVTALPVTVIIAATAAPRPGDIRAQPDGNWRAMYAPGVSPGNNWIGVNPANGGIWLKDSDVNSWLDVEGPTGTETSGGGPYSPGDIKVPPGSVAGSVMFFMVKSGPPLSDVAVWMACSTYNACHAVKESHLQMGMGWDGVPYSEWVDLRIT